MYQKILVPVDGSATARSALQEAVKLAKRINAQLELVHVFEDMLYWLDEGYINYAELQESFKKSGEHMLAEAKSIVQQAGLTAEIKSLEAKDGQIAPAIVAEAERWQAELIVIGTHGRSGFSRLLLGSVAERVVRSAPMPVLLVRGGEYSIDSDQRSV